MSVQSLLVPLWQGSRACWELVEEEAAPIVAGRKQSKGGRTTVPISSLRLSCLSSFFPLFLRQQHWGLGITRTIGEGLGVKLLQSQSCSWAAEWRGEKGSGATIQSVTGTAPPLWNPGG